MPHVSSLKPGNELHGWMKLGRALTVHRDVHGYITRVVPEKVQVARVDDLVAFIGWVISNDPVNKTITMQVSRLGPRANLAQEPDYVATIPYKYIDKLRVLSAVRYPAHEDSPFHPTDNTKWLPYRTLTEVSLV